MIDSPPAKSPRITDSATVWTVACLIMVNVILNLTPIHFDNLAYPYKAWSWWCMNDLHKSDHSFNVALLGSSLVVTANSGCDATFLNRTVNLTKHHRASYLDYALTSKFGGDYRTFNLAAPGQMVSDAYLSLKAMLSMGKRPEALVYCVGPRDFIDATLSSPSETELIGYLARIVSVAEVADDLYVEPFARLNWWLRQSIPCYGRSADFQIVTTNTVNQVLARLAPRPDGGKPYALPDRRRILPDFNKAETLPEISLVHPIDPASLSFADNSGEYIERYGNPTGSLYQTERKFFDRITDLCEQEDIKLVVVNMPLMAANKELLPAAFLTAYVSDLEKSCTKSGALFLDFSNAKDFTQSDFQDPVHLNGIGGRKLYDRVVESIRSNTAFAAKVAVIGASSKRRTSLAGQAQIAH